MKDKPASALIDEAIAALDPKSETHGLSSVHAIVQMFSIDEQPPPNAADSVKHAVPVAHEASGTLQECPAGI